MISFRKPVYNNAQSEIAFRHWQKENETKLNTIYGEKFDPLKGEFDLFCAQVYTGRRSLTTGEII